MALLHPRLRKSCLTKGCCSHLAETGQSGDPGHPQGKLLEAQRLNLGRRGLRGVGEGWLAVETPITNPRPPTIDELS